VYVDDFKMAGPVENLPKAWNLIRETGPTPIKMDEPALLKDSKFLGCEHSVVTEDGVTFIEYNMKSSLVKCVEKYQELSGTYKAPLKNVPTPFVDEDAVDRAIKMEQETMSCKHCGSHSWAIEVSRDIDAKNGNGSSGPKSNNGNGSYGPKSVERCIESGATAPGDDEDDEPIDGETRGVLGPIASQVLMQILYTARYCRHDLLRATGRLATMVTKWNTECDRRLHA
jgi:hypothetical protein